MNTDKMFLKRILYLVGITMGVYLFIQYILPLIIPFLIAGILAGLLFPIIKTIHNKVRLPYRLASIILVSFIVLLCSVVIGIIGYYLFVQTKELIINYPFFKNNFLRGTKQICYCCDEWLGVKSGQMYSMVSDAALYVGKNWNDKVMPVVTKNVWGVFTGLGKSLVLILFVIVGTALILDDYKNIKCDLGRSFIYKKMIPVIKSIRETMWAYLKTQFIIIVIVMVICTAGLMVIGNPYALVLGLLIAVIDAFPILGSGSILIPWALYYIFSKNYMNAAVLVTVYVICLLVREILEPKIMGQQTGLRPIYTFISFYVGISLFGIAGILLGPLGAVVIRKIYYDCIEL